MSWSHIYGRPPQTNYSFPLASFVTICRCQKLPNLSIFAIVMVDFLNSIMNITVHFTYNIMLLYLLNSDYNYNTVFIQSLECMFETLLCYEYSVNYNCILIVALEQVLQWQAHRLMWQVVLLSHACNWPIDSPPKMASWRTSFVRPSIYSLVNHAYAIAITITLSDNWSVIS